MIKECAFSVTSFFEKPVPMEPDECCILISEKLVVSDFVYS